MEPTLNERIWQWLDGHKQEFFDWWASQTKDASQLELVAFDADRHVGALMTYSSGGVKKVVNVSPSSLVEGETAESLNTRAERLISEMEAFERALDNAEQSRVSAEALREEQEARRQLQEQQRNDLFLNNETLRQEIFDNDERQRQQTADLRENQRQDDFEANEALRQQDFIEAENDRMQAILLTKFYIDPDTMELHAVQVEPDRTQYSINDNGELIAKFEVED